MWQLTCFKDYLVTIIKALHKMLPSDFVFCQLVAWCGFYWCYWAVKGTNTNDYFIYFLQCTTPMFFSDSFFFHFICCNQRTSVWYSFDDIKNIPAFFTEKTRMEIMYHMSSSSLEFGWRRKSTEIPMNWSPFCSKHRPQTRSNFTTCSPVYNFHFKVYTKGW